MTKIALVPYWLKEPPQQAISAASANLWWFEPLLTRFDYVIFIGHDIKAGDQFYSTARALILTYRIRSNLIQVIDLRDQILQSLGLSRAEFTIWHVIEASISYRLVGGRDQGIKAIACVGDLHHMSNPITDTRSVLARYKYDYLLLTHPQYSHFFEVTNLYARGKNILPFPVCSNLLKSCQNHATELRHSGEYPIIPVLFGPSLTTVTHPFRQLIASAALDAGFIQLHDERLKFNTWIDSVAATNAVFTCSLNGSYSLQTLAPLANERLLITDVISKRNHVGAHLVHGHNCLIYNHPRDMRTIIQACQNPANNRVIAERGNALFASLQKADNVTNNLLAESRPEALEPDLDLSAYLIPDLVVELVETIQELHRISLRIKVLVASDYPMLDSLRSSIDQLLPRLSLQSVYRKTLIDYADSLGCSISQYDYLLIIMKPINSSASVVCSHHRLPILILKCTQSPSQRYLSEDHAFNWLQSVCGLPLWKQKSEQLMLQRLGSIYPGHKSIH